MTPSLAVEAAVYRWTERLARAFDRIHHVAVVVEEPHRSQRHGQGFHVRVEVAVPECTIAVSHAPGRDPAHENVYIALNDAFRAARRQLQDHARIRRGETKLHA